MKLSKKNNKFVSILSIIAILFALSPISAFAATPPNDIADHWAKDQIQSWVDSGYIKGYPDGTFKPDNNITRAEFMTIANNAFGYTEKAEINYSDVADGSWYADAVATAKAAGYINGYPDGTMKPNAPITRQEATVIISKIDALTAGEAAADNFTDAASIPAWSKGSVGACVTAQIFNGYPNGSFLAENNIERGESVVALSKALAYKNAPAAVAKSVTEITAEGFQLNLTPAVEGLTQSAVTLTQVDSSVTDGAINVTTTAITTADNGATYSVAAALVEGQTYKLNLVMDGYNFGGDTTFTVLTAQQIADQAAADSVTAKIAALPNAADITLADLTAVNEAEDSFGVLTEAQKALVSSENQTKLNDAIAKIDSLQTPAN
jgi:hypothetical protein